MPGIALEIRRKCKVCGKVFIAKKLDSQFCSKRCSSILSDGTEENSSADVNQNGDVDISDVVRLVNIILSDDSPTPPEITTIITNVGIDY